MKEAIDVDSGYSIDLLLLAGGAGGEGRGRGGGREREGLSIGAEERSAGVAIEVDGPGHFLRPGGRVVSGSTLMKRRHLELLGYRLVSVPYYEWNALQGEEGEDEYLRLRIQEARARA